MPRFYTAAIALLCLFTLSIAAQTSPENDGATTQVALPDSDDKSVIRLPTDPSNAEADKTTAVVESSVSVPLTKITFHAVNRRFPIGSKKGCHHSKVSPTENEHKVISYGNDMLVASGESSDFQNPVVYGEDRSIHHRWARMHHHRRHHNHDEDSDSDSDSDNEEDQKEKPFVLKRYHFDGEEKGLKKKACFFKRLRKFLGHYF